MIRIDSQRWNFHMKYTKIVRIEFRCLKRAGNYQNMIETLPCNKISRRIYFFNLYCIVAFILHVIVSRNLEHFHSFYQIKILFSVYDHFKWKFMLSGKGQDDPPVKMELSKGSW